MENMDLMYAATPNNPSGQPPQQRPSSTPEQVNERDAQRFAETEKRLQELREMLEKLKKNK